MVNFDGLINLKKKCNDNENENKNEMNSYVERQHTHVTLYNHTLYENMKNYGKRMH